MSRNVLSVCALLLMMTACHTQTGGRRTMGRVPRADLLKDATERYNTKKVADGRRDDNAPIQDGQYVDTLEVSSFRMKKKYPWYSDNYEWVAAIHSKYQYTPLNLGRGWTYIFRDPAGDTAHRFVAVPEDPTLKVRYLIYSPYVDLTGGKPGPPLIIIKKSKLRADSFVLGGCFECGALHCSSMDAGDLY